MFDDLKKLPGDPIRASDWNKLIDAISSAERLRSAHFPSIGRAPLAMPSGRIAQHGAGFSLRSINYVSSDAIAYFNPGYVYVDDIRIVPTINGTPMDTIPYPELSVTAGALFVVLAKSSESSTFNSASITQSQPTEGKYYQLGVFKNEANTLRYYPEHTGNIVLNQSSGGGSVNIYQNSPAYGGEFIITNPDGPTEEIYHRCLIAGPGITLSGGNSDYLEISSSGGGSVSTQKLGLGSTYGGAYFIANADGPVATINHKPLLVGDGLILTDTDDYIALNTSGESMWTTEKVQVGMRLHYFDYNSWPTTFAQFKDFTFTAGQLTSVGEMYEVEITPTSP